MKVFSLEFGMQLHYFKGGGGGSASGAIDFPTHMKDWHSMALDSNTVDTLTNSMTDAMNAAYGSSPYSGEDAYDPDADITAYEAAITGFAAIIAGMDEEVDWASLFVQAETSIGVIADIAVDGISEAEIVADIDAFADQLDDEILVKVLPRFEAGMRDIGAVVSSAFALGRSNIEGFRDREVAKHASALRLAAEYKNADVELDEAKANLTKELGSIGAYTEGTSQMIQLLIARYAWEESYTKVVIEGKRIKIVAKKEETESNLKIDELDALWDLKTFRYGGNLLGSISGTAVTEEMKPEVWPSVIGGALSGAMAGAMYGGTKGAVVGGGWGIAIGAVVGAAAGYLTA